MKCFSPKIFEISNPTRVWAVLLAVVLLVLPLLLLAAPNPQVNYQGKLTDPLGVAVTDGGHTMVFRLYTVPTGGTAIWTETRSGGNQVQTIDGLFSVMLGSVSSLSGVNFGQTLYLGVTVGADGEMTPRRVLGTVPAAFETFQLGGVASSSFLRSDQADTMTAFLTLTGGASADNLLVSGTATTAALAVGVDRITDLTGAGLSVVGNALTANIASGQIVDDTITTADISYALTLAGNPVLNANEVFFGTNGLIFESTAADNFEGLLDASALTADRTWTLPNTTGAIALTTSAMTGTFDGNDFAGGAIGTGDLLYGSAAGSISELAIGTNGRVLSVVGGLPAWVATSTLGIGGGGSSLFTDGGTTTYLTSTSDNLNIGASSATSFKLHVNGAIAQFGDRILFNADAAGVAGGSQSLFVGNGGQSIASGGYYNSSVGINALAALTTGYRNTAIGNYALSTVTTGGNNTALGSYALGNASSSVQAVIAIGTYAAENQSSLNTGDIIAIGNYALRAGTGEHAYGTIAIGHRAMEFASTTHGATIAIGSNVLRSTTGVSNVGVGHNALYDNTTGGNNIAIGNDSLRANTTGFYNVAIGSYSMDSNLTGNYNTAVGLETLANAVSTNFNTALGRLAGNELTSGSGNNTFLGHNTGRGITTGAENTIIGANVTGLASTTSNNIILADGAGNQRIRVDASGNVGIGTTTPTQRLHIQGNARLTGALYDSTNSAGTAGYVLQSTATGVQWVATSTLGIGGGGSSLFTDGGTTTYLTSTGDNLAVGTTSTAFKLGVQGVMGMGGRQVLRNSDMFSTNNDSVNSLFVGDGGQSVGTGWTEGNETTGVGFGALYALTTGQKNTALGTYALENLTSSGENVAIGTGAARQYDGFGQTVAIGYAALENVTGGYGYLAIGSNALRNGGGSLAIGANALSNASGAFSNFAVGLEALRNTTTGSVNYAIGDEVLLNNISGNDNLGIGFHALHQNISGNNNLAIGNNALQTATSSSDNFAIGRHALENSVASNNFALGRNALNDNTTGYDNMAIGQGALELSTTGNNNTVVGQRAGGSVTTGGDNTFLGTRAGGGESWMGWGVTTGSGNIAIGREAMVASATANNQLSIGNLIYGTGLDGTGTSLSSGNIGIGTTTPTQRLHIQGNARLTGALYDSSNSAGTAGYVLQTTATGVQWVATSTLGIGGGGSSLFTDGGSTTYLTSTGDNLAIGATTTTFKLDVSGAIAQGGQRLLYNADALNSYEGTLFVGNGGQSLDGASWPNGRYNTGVGVDSLLSITTGRGNTALGFESLYNLTTGNNNTAIGNNALGNASSSVTGMIAIGNEAAENQSALNTAGIVAIGNGALRAGAGEFSWGAIAIGNNAMRYGSPTHAAPIAIGNNALANNQANNVAIGFDSMVNTTTGTDNIAIGAETLFDNVTGNSNVALGWQALGDNTTGGGNTAIGTRALWRNITGSNNIGIGNGVLDKATSTGHTIAMGQFSLYNTTNSYGNIGLGSYTLNQTTTGSDNIAFGINALRSNTTGSRSIAIGVDAGRDATATGNAQNTFLGYNTGRGITTGTNNTILGANVTGLSSSLSNSIILADGAGNQRIRVDASGNVGIGTTTPTQRLHIQGNARLTGALYDGSNSAGTSGYVLQTTATGVQWVATSTLGIGGGGSSLFTDGGSTTYLTSTSDNLAVGTTTTTAKLGVFGDLDIAASNSGLSFLGERVLYANPTSYNLIFGLRAGEDLESTGGANITIGIEAAQFASSTNVSDGIFLGNQSGRYNTGYQVNAIGLQAGLNNSGDYNNFLGDAGVNNSGSYNNLFGNAAGRSNEGDFNNLLGTAAGRQNSGSSVNAFGGFAGFDNLGSYNNFIGEESGYSNTGDHNNMIGYSAGANNNGANNNMIGSSAGVLLDASYSDIIGSLAFYGGSGVYQAANNVGLGYRAGYNARTGANNNIFIGFQAADNVTTGANNIVLGYNTDLQNPAGSNQLAIGNLIFGTGVNGTGTTISTGNIGIGTTTPTQRLHIQGNARLTGALYDGSNSAGTSGYVLQSTATGVQWIATSTLGIGGGGSSLFTDGGSLTYLTSTSDNLAVGTSTQIGGARLSVAGNVSVSELNGYYIGTKRMLSVYDGPFVELTNVFVGSEASSIDTATAYQNTVVGSSALEDLTTGRFNTAIGTFALSNATSTEGNTAVGALTLSNLQSGMGNTAIGSNALHANQSGSDNIAIGVVALYNKTSGDRNIAIGASALFNDISGSRSIAIGFEAGADSTTTGNAQNIFLGYNTGRGITTGTNNTIIGGNVTGLVSTTSNNIILADGAGNQRLRIDASGNVGIGTTTPTAQLHTTGSVRFENFGAGTLQTDASGNVSVSSDERLKKVVGGYEAGLDEILAIEPIQYHWRKETGFDTEGLYTGFSAQNVKDALPEAVGEDKHGFLTLSDRPILAAVVNAIKELWQRMTETESRVDALEAEVAALRAALEASGSGGSYVPPPPPPEEEPNDDTVDEDVVEGEDESGSGDTSDAGESDSPVDDESVEDTAADEPVVDDESGEDAETAEDAGSPEPETGV